MLKFLPAPLAGLITGILFAVNTVILVSAQFPFILLKVFIPNSLIRHHLTRVIMAIGTLWIDLNDHIKDLCRSTKWDVQGLDKDFSLGSSYLVVSNHRSWSDIFVLQHIFNHRIPFLKFFLKKELIWVPVLGVAWWGLDFPFMKRYSRQYLEKYPERKGKDMETTRKFCEKYKISPVTVLNFLEGTRFNYQKHENQESPFQHLLKPKAGGVAVVLSSMGEYFSKIIDVTIVYPDNAPPMPFWNFLKGDVPTIAVRVRTIDIPEEFIGKDYEEDLIFKEQFQEWINQLWKDKDQVVENVLSEYNVDSKINL